MWLNAWPFCWFLAGAIFSYVVIAPFQCFWYGLHNLCIAIHKEYNDD